MTSEAHEARVSRVLLWALALLALARLLSLGFYPLMDMTESRYADIARRMVERGDWVTPWFTDTQPFWGKPALSFWATAIGFEVFGVNEWGARVPHFVLGLGVAAVAWFHARAASQRVAWHTVALLAGALLFTVSSGAVMTDMTLVLGTTLVMAGFWAAVGREAAAPHGKWIMLVGLAVGLLAKGPIALVLCGPPIAGWVLWQRRLGETWRRVPWLLGALALVLLVAPWYAAAEARTPGFLNYFLVGEHWKRFTTPGWTGDLYGSAHSFKRGSIWIFAIVAALPWTLLLPLAAATRPARSASTLAPGERLYLLLWALWPCVFFTVAGNILWTYVLPGLPAMALLAAAWTASLRQAKRTDGGLAAVLALLALSIPLLLALGQRSGQFERNSMKSLVQAYTAAAQPGQPLLELPRTSFSTQFYSGGKAAALPDARALLALPADKTAFVLLRSGELARLPAEVQRGLTPVSATASFQLLRWRTAP